MSGRVEIHPAEIRKGDLIRWERHRADKSAVSAVEYRAVCSGDRHISVGQAANFGQHYLLERPAPAVSLPSVPTLGWLDSIGNTHALGIWRSQPLTGGVGVVNIRGDSGALDFEITAFTEAVAVPKSALDELRFAQVFPLSEVATFLAAVDNASTR